MEWIKSDRNCYTRIRKVTLLSVCMFVPPKQKKKAISPADMRFNDGILPNCLLDNFLSLSFKVSIYFSSYLNKPGAIVVLMAQLIISMEIRYVSRVCFFSLFYHLSLSFFKVKAVSVRSTQVFNLLRHSCLIIYNKMLICSNIKWIRSKAK